jgi:hypothetical protein
MSWYKLFYLLACLFLLIQLDSFHQLALASVLVLPLVLALALALIHHHRTIF